MDVWCRAAGGWRRRAFLAGGRPAPSCPPRGLALTDTGAARRALRQGAHQTGASRDALHVAVAAPAWRLPSSRRNGGLGHLAAITGTDNLSMPRNVGHFCIAP